MTIEEIKQLIDTDKSTLRGIENGGDLPHDIFEAEFGGHKMTREEWRIQLRDQIIGHQEVLIRALSPNEG